MLRWNTISITEVLAHPPRGQQSLWVPRLLSLPTLIVTWPSLHKGVAVYCRNWHLSDLGLPQPRPRTWGSRAGWKFPFCGRPSPTQPLHLSAVAALYVTNVLECPRRLPTWVSGVLTSVPPRPHSSSPDPASHCHLDSEVAASVLRGSKIP